MEGPNEVADEIELSPILIVVRELNELVAVTALDTRFYQHSDGSPSHFHLSST